VAVGYNAGAGVTTGIKNTLIGAIAGDALTDADSNVAVGRAALSTDTLGSCSVAIGRNALIVQNFTTATDTFNVAVGDRAGAAITTGARNTLIGGTCGDAIQAGNQNTFIGYNIATSGVNVENQIAIGVSGTAGAAGTARFIIGSNTATLGIDGSDTSWAAASSDERLKENIETSTAGLSFIKDLRPVTYNWKKKKDVASDIPHYYEEGSDEPVLGYVYGRKLHGFIAQEVKTAIDNNSSDLADGFKFHQQGDHGMQTVADGNLIPMLTKAVQELSTALDAALARIATLEG
jgi:hypothetical protein